jgi:radical SAM superfamily enzyme
MEKEYAEHPNDFLRMSLDEYLDFIVDILERLRPDLYIERIAGEVPPRFVNVAQWGLVRNVEILRMLDKKLSDSNSFQGKLYIKE